MQFDFPAGYFQIFETSWDNQEGSKYGKPQFFNTQEEADSFCENLQEENNGYLYIAERLKPSDQLGFME